MTQAVIIERNKRQTTGTPLFLYTYPHAITDKNGNIERFERRVQRCAVTTDEGNIWHFTVPLSMQTINE